MLTLVALLRERGYEATVLNLDALFIDFRKSAENHAGDSDSTSPYFFDFVSSHLQAVSCDLFGFSSLCSSYPLTMRLVELTKKLNPSSTIVLGGPQASVVDVATMRAFPCVDFVVRGEADETFPTLVNLLSEQHPERELEVLPGITFRRYGEIVRNPNAPVIQDLDALPLPAFDLDPDFENRGSVYLEIGRGCPFVCTFCSTNDFFRRSFRLKSPEKMIEHMTSIKRAHGIGNFCLIHDMYTIDKKKVTAFCDALSKSGEGFTWTCSARTDCIDDDMIALMAERGCLGIFFGIETGSARLQTVIKKKLDLAEARKRIQCADRHQIKTAVALITAFPDETRDDLRDTAEFFLDSLRFDYADPQMSLLAPLAATPIYEEHKDDLVLDDFFSDMSYQGWMQDPADLEMIKSYPDMFSNFYAVPTRWLERRYFKEVRDFVTYLATRFRWLAVALKQDSGDILRVFDSWHAWLATKTDDPSRPDLGRVPYYCHGQFRLDFLEFVRSCYLPEMATARVAIATLLESEESHFITSKSVSPETASGDGLNDASFPFVPAKSCLMELPGDYNEIIQALRTAADLRDVAERNVTIVFRPSEHKRIQVWQLAPLSDALIRLCDGKRSVGEITKDFARFDIDVPGVAPQAACRFGLAQLWNDGLIDVSRRPIFIDTETGSTEGDHELQRYSPPPAVSNTPQPWPWPTTGGTESTS